MKSIFKTEANNENKDYKEDEAILIYDIKNTRKKIKIFGDIFVKNNKNICKIIYQDKEYELQSTFDKDKIIKKDINFEIKLIGLNKITDMSYMFYECSSLKEIFNLSNINTINIIDMSYMFYGCSKLSSIPDISKWDISQVKNLQGEFEKCKSLNNFPNISKWNTSKILVLYLKNVYH